ncbi:40S small subunit ribosomal protein uS19 (rpS15) [Andalucia godoyi]|uniref:40S small subunit ribosomal protein uS19 (RpS15) n=1 Tax=Andalucia godoyi TaxID=505711 RepID=A0A8K0AH05_ANDGO|nr:40S small subunit ribosomal protein uS19 (rpS15) [Andalucia godoyi]WCZ58617.1 40S ribosomal protein S15 [Andalucia godoyi]|eukprot:ANDGO_00949.mRNA.1 40S small subunit ribosomal protein uS19 (rpS15)
MADKSTKLEELKKKRTFRKYSFRGVELDNLLDLNDEQFAQMLTCRHRRKFNRGVKLGVQTLLKKCRKSKKDLKIGEKPEPVKTHLRNVTIVPDMIGSVIGVYNGKGFVAVDVKADMLGYYLGEFALTYKPVGHGRAGAAATAAAAKFMPV